jgi:tRNA modification GTPase
LYFGTFGDERETIDEVILAPRHDRSGALVGVDISAHGGIRVVERILMTLTQRGAMLSSPGEFSFAESCEAQGEWPAQIINDAMRRLMRTTTRRTAMFLMNQAEVLPAAYSHIVELSEAGNEDTARAELRSIIGRSHRARHLIVPPKISVIGPPNAGKSSLVNALAGRDHVIVSDAEGTTRDWVTVPAVIEGIELTLIDTAGLREAPSALEEIAIHRGRSASAACDLRLCVLDRSVEVTGNLRATLARLDDHDILVANKSDLPVGDGWTALLDKLATPALAVSAATGDGLDELRKAMVGGLDMDGFDDALPAEFDADRLAKLEVGYRTNSNSGTSLAEIIKALCARQ